jgi:hypothetical protein
MQLTLHTLGVSQVRLPNCPSPDLAQSSCTTPWSFTLNVRERLLLAFFSLLHIDVFGKEALC